MTQPPSHHGFGTLVNHYQESNNPLNAHITPIFQTSAFRFPDFETGLAIENGEQAGYVYTRVAAPNADQLARKIALLEGIDLLRQNPGVQPESLVAGQVFASGMAAISAAILGRVKSGDCIVAQKSLYGHTFNFLDSFARKLGVSVVWVPDPTPEGWEAAFQSAPRAVLAYAETPVNPTLQTVDLAAAAEIAHRHHSWLLVDNTFATPYCQRPLTLGADVVVHSTTKYISGHGVIIGGAVISAHPEYIEKDVNQMLALLGGAPSPMDAWLTNIGLKTFELRMERHCANALALAQFLESHPKVERVYYPGLESSPSYAVARRQMLSFGGMLSFELKGGLQAASQLLNRLKVITLAVSLGNVDSLIQHPASMTHHTVPAEEREQMGISDGLMRLSVGIENLADLQEDLLQGLG